jgi:hypothetical protein
MTKEADHPPTPSTENWLREILRLANVTENSPLAEIAEETNKLAMSTAPVARSWWKWLILIQGASVAVPVLAPSHAPFSKDAHRDVYRWYTRTISTESPGADGFGRSPFCPKK